MIISVSIVYRYSTKVSLIIVTFIIYYNTTIRASNIKKEFKL